MREESERERKTLDRAESDESQVTERVSDELLRVKKGKILIFKRRK